MGAASKRLKWLLVIIFVMAVCPMTAWAAGSEAEEIQPECGEYVFWAESEEYAHTVAENYGALLVSFENGIGVLNLPEQEMPDEVFSEELMPRLFLAGASEEKPGNLELPELYPNYIYRLDVEPEAVSGNETAYQWHMEYLEMEEVWQLAAGEGIRIAIVDSGIDADHAALAQNIELAESVIPDTSYGGAGYPLEYKGPEDQLGHGTHVAGIIAAVTEDGTVMGIAPKSRIYSYKALERKGNSATGYTSWIANGILSAVEDGADIINLSLGGSVSEDKFVSQAIDIAVENGCFGVCAAGNYTRTGSQEGISYPASDPDTIAVTAAKMTDEVAEIDLAYSKYGAGVTFIAPGTDIYSTDLNGSFSAKKGTSMAAPMVSAVIALLKEELPDADVQEILEILEETALDLGKEGVDKYYGYGMIQPLKALQSIQEEAPDDPGSGDDSGETPEDPGTGEKPEDGESGQEPSDKPQQDAKPGSGAEPDVKPEPEQKPVITPEPDVVKAPEKAKEEEKDPQASDIGLPAGDESDIPEKEIEELREEMQNISPEDQKEYETQENNDESKGIRFPWLLLLLIVLVTGRLLLKKKQI